MVIQQQIMSTVQQQKLRHFSTQAANIITINNNGNVFGIEAEKLGLSSTLDIHLKEEKLFQKTISSLQITKPDKTVVIENTIKKRRYNKHHLNDKINIKTARQHQRLHKTSHRQYVQENQQKLTKCKFNNLNDKELNYTNGIESYRQQQSNKQAEKNCLNNFQTQEQQLLTQRNQIINSTDLTTISTLLPGM